MKYTAAAAVTLFTVTAATAGSLDVPADPPVMAPVVIEEAAASSSAPAPLLVLGLTAAVVFGAAAAH
jgi:hypothetical protein